MFDVTTIANGMVLLTPPGFIVEDHKLTLYGRCNLCP
ncbi:Fe2+ or Zn2+ uptake regulation protein [Roseateles asaccharophilus]